MPIEAEAPIASDTPSDEPAPEANPEAEGDAEAPVEESADITDAEEATAEEAIDTSPTTSQEEQPNMADEIDLTAADAPPDLGKGAQGDLSELPPAMRRELAALGLI